jgi:hypothetical protein
MNILCMEILMCACCCPCFTIIIILYSVTRRTQPSSIRCRSINGTEWRPSTTQWWDWTTNIKVSFLLPFYLFCFFPFVFLMMRITNTQLMFFHFFRLQHVECELNDIVHQQGRDTESFTKLVKEQKEINAKIKVRSCYCLNTKECIGPFAFPSFF